MPVESPYLTGILRTLSFVGEVAPLISRAIATRFVSLTRSCVTRSPFLILVDGSDSVVRGEGKEGPFGVSLPSWVSCLVVAFYGDLSAFVGWVPR